MMTAWLSTVSYMNQGSVFYTGIGCGIRFILQCLCEEAIRNSSSFDNAMNAFSPSSLFPFVFVFIRVIRETHPPAPQ